MKLYGGSLSPFFRKVRVVFEEKGISYETERLPPVPKTPELLAMHPLGKIPILRDGDVVVPDSSVICAYLERAHPAPALYPERAADLAAALFFEEYSDTRMAELIGAINFETVVKPRILQQEPDLARAAEFRARLPEVYDYLESRLSADREWLLPRFGIADIAVGCQLQGLAFAGEEIDAARWPRTAVYRRAIEARPSFKPAIS
jgi:glutathione S-transferase